MRTTLTLDPDVELLLKEETHRSRRPLKQIVNDALRRFLTRTEHDKPDLPYRIEPHRASLQPGLDRLALNRLADELESDAALAKVKR